MNSEREKLSSNEIYLFSWNSNDFGAHVEQELQFQESFYIIHST